jgi:hypothetical protein
LRRTSRADDDASAIAVDAAAATEGSDNGNDVDDDDDDDDTEDDDEVLNGRPRDGPACWFRSLVMVVQVAGGSCGGDMVAVSSVVTESLRIKPAR